MQDGDGPVTCSDWERIERYCDFELTQECDACGHHNQCDFYDRCRYCLLFAVHHAMMSPDYGPGKKCKDLSQLRNKLHREMSSATNGNTGGNRVPSPNCVTSGISAMMHGHGDFKGFRLAENVNPNSG